MMIPNKNGKTMFKIIFNGIVALAVTLIAAIAVIAVFSETVVVSDSNCQVSTMTENDLTLEELHELCE